MWKSPIDVIYEDVQTQFEDNVLKAVHNVNIFVDREELIKALEYDRGQYEKGYHDGVSEVQKIGKWIEDDDATVKGHCSVCGWESHYYEDDVVGMPFCPNCGAKMESEQ